jgi:hypothetical protein
VTVAIQFHDQHSFATCEVGEKLPDRMLTTKLDAQPSAAQLAPQHLFGRNLGVSKLSC